MSAGFMSPSVTAIETVHQQAARLFVVLLQLYIVRPVVVLQELFHMLDGVPRVADACVLKSSDMSSDVTT